MNHSPSSSTGRPISAPHYSASTSSLPLYSPPAYTYHSNNTGQFEELFEPLSSLPLEAPPSFELCQLSKPLCVPQLNSGIDAPFVRVYNSELMGADVQMQDWLAFVDGLNKVHRASPPIKVLEVVGGVVSMIPELWISLAGGLVQAGAATGAHLLSKSLSDKYLERANRTYFEPRGLRVFVCRTAAMRQLVKLDQPPAKQRSRPVEVATNLGASTERMGLQVPGLRRLITKLHPAPPVDESTGSNFVERRLATVKGHVLPLDFGVPEAPPETKPVGKMNAWAVRYEENFNRKAQLRAVKARVRLADALAGRDVERNESEENLNDINDRTKRHSEDLEQEEKRIKKLPRKVRVEDRKEATSAKGMLWIVVLNADQVVEVPGLTTREKSKSWKRDR